MKPESRTKLRTVSTPTVATALFKRGFRVQAIQGVRPLSPLKAAMVGEAFTLRYIPAREDLNPISVFQDRAHPQRKAVEECPAGTRSIATRWASVRLSSCPVQSRSSRAGM